MHGFPEPLLGIEHHGLDAAVLQAEHFQNQF